MAKKHRFLPYLMWGLPLSFFTYQFILRLWPSLMMQQIMQQFAIDATSFGVLASVYYYGYASMQIPVAYVLDRIDPRVVIFLCAVLCGMATFLFTFTENWYLALCARFFVGAGSAIGFLGTSKIVSGWFPKDHYARMIGFTFMIGLMGAIYGGKPIGLLNESFGWQHVAVTLASVAMGIGILTYLFLRMPKTALNQSLETHPQNPLKLSDFKTVFSFPTLWFLAIANLLMVGSLEGFADVWGVNYLMEAYHLNKGDAAELTSFIFVGMMFGGPLLAGLSRKLGCYVMICVCGLGMAGGFSSLFFLNGVLGWGLLATLFFIIGLMCCYQVLIFAAGFDLVRVELLGVSIAFLNCANMIGGSFFHTVIGFMMDTFWTGTIGSDGIRSYTLESYKHALMIIPVCSIIGAIIVGCIGWQLRKESRNLLSR